MSFSTLKPVTSCQISPTGANDSRSQVSRVSVMQRRALPLRQVKGKERPLLQESFNTGTSRRELFHLTATSLGFISLLSPAYAAEVQTKNASILEKMVEKLNEFAGLSKPKEEAKEKKEEAKDTTKSKVKNGPGEKKNNGGEEKKPTTSAPIPPIEKPPVPAPPTTINGKTVETSALP